MNTQFDDLRPYDIDPEKRYYYKFGRFAKSRGLTLLMRKVLEFKKYGDKSLSEIYHIIRNDPHTLNKQNEKKISALALACSNLQNYDYSKVIRLLIDAGADVNLSVRKNVTPIMFVSVSPYDNIVKMFIDAGCDIDIQNDINNFNVLLFSCFALRDKICTIDRIKQVINTGCNLNSQTKKGTAPLILAAKHNMFDLVKLLIKAKCNLDIQDNYGNTALIYAAEKGYKNICRELINAGCNIYIENESGTDAGDVSNILTSIFLRNEKLRKYSLIDLCSNLIVKNRIEYFKKYIRYHTNRDVLTILEKKKMFVL